MPGKLTTTWSTLRSKASNQGRAMPAPTVHVDEGRRCTPMSTSLCVQLCLPGPWCIESFPCRQVSGWRSHGISQRGGPEYLVYPCSAPAIASDLIVTDGLCASLLEEMSGLVSQPQSAVLEVSPFIPSSGNGTSRTLDTTQGLCYRC